MNDQFFRRELDRVHGQKRSSSVRMFICCPWHNEKEPSGSVWLGLPKKGLAQGDFKCWGCKKRATWNELAEKLGLTQIDGTRVLPEDVAAIDLTKIRTSLLDVDKGTTEVLDLFPLQESRWRGFRKEFLEQVCDAKLAYKDETGKFYTYLPVLVKGKQVGYIKAQMRKDKSKKVPSYLNKEGSWVLKRGLFPFDYAVRLMKSLGITTMVLVEGPRDALRLLRDRVPAVALLGVNNWTPSKRLLLESVGVDRIVLMTDGDKAGREAIDKLLPDLNPFMQVRVYKLWVVAKKLGLEKVDPCTAPAEVVQHLKRVIRRLEKSK